MVIVTNPDKELIRFSDRQNGRMEAHFDIPSSDLEVVETACQIMAIASVMLWKGNTQKREEIVFIAHGIDCESSWVTCNHWITSSYLNMRLDKKTTRYTGRSHSRMNDLRCIRAAYLPSQRPCRACGAIHKLKATVLCPTCGQTF